MKLLLTGLLATICPTFLFSQQKDSIPYGMLDTVVITSFIKQGIPRHLPATDNVYIYEGKKTISLNLNEGNANLAKNESRMAFAQIPGLNIWEMDGSGTQVNIGNRGTDSHRSIEMNMRQNGYVTNSALFGYPENHYTAAMQGIQEVQLVRGSAALQFGSQFGGMMNYIMKQGDSTKPFAAESGQTAGANRFFNSYNAVGGTIGKTDYYAYYDNRHGDGWRPNAAFNYHAYYANIGYRFNEKGSIRFQFSRMDYVQKIAGGLTDAQFNQNAKQSFRSRNYFSPEINIPAVIFNYKLASYARLEITSHALFGQRNSVQFINTPDIMDTVNKSLGTYNPRQVDRDYYTAFTTEARLLYDYTLKSMHNSLAAGVRYGTEYIRRSQKGAGTTGNDFDLSLVRPYGIDLHLHTNNYAVFAENIFQLTRRFSLTPGFRYEVIASKMNGVINNATYPVSYTGNRNFPLFGTGMQYALNPSMQLYGNISQAYRPFLYASITPADQVGVIDPDLKDSRGYDADLGYRGHYLNAIHFDISLFYLHYGNRIGQLTLINPDRSTYLFTTNIGNSLAKGVESYLNVSLWKLLAGKSSASDIRIFNALAYTHARYTSGEVSYNGKNIPLSGNHVEGAPDWINRTGLQFQYKGIASTIQYSYVSSGFSDANNTVYNPTGATGYIPAYHVWDWAFNWQFFTSYHCSAGINNIADARYFTRRINMYPGPGILPADGRTFYVSLGVKM